MSRTEAPAKELGGSSSSGTSTCRKKKTKKKEKKEMGKRKKKTRTFLDALLRKSHGPEQNRQIKKKNCRDDGEFRVKMMMLAVRGEM